MRDIIGLNLNDITNLSKCGLNPNVPGSENDQQQTVETIVEFTLKLCGNRCFSQAVHDCPPYCYAGLFSRREADKEAAAALMKTHWRMICQFENTVTFGSQVQRAQSHHVFLSLAAQQTKQGLHYWGGGEVQTRLARWTQKNLYAWSAAFSQELVSDLLEVLPPAVRIMYMAFEKDSWAPRSRGRRILATMLACLPDSKVVEDTHQHLRDLQRLGRSTVSSKAPWEISDGVSMQLPDTGPRASSRLRSRSSLPARCRVLVPGQLSAPG